MVRLPEKEPVFDEPVEQKLFHKDLKKDIMKYVDEKEMTYSDLRNVLLEKHPKKYEGIQTTDIKFACVQLAAEGKIIDR